MRTVRGNKNQKAVYDVRLLILMIIMASVITAVPLLFLPSDNRDSVTISWWQTGVAEMMKNHGFFLTSAGIPPLNELDKVFDASHRTPALEYVFHRGRPYIVVSDDYRLPTERLTVSTIENFGSIQPFWQQFEWHNRKFHDFAHWIPDANEHAAYILRFHWPYGTGSLQTKELSGLQWIRRYSTSKSTKDLYPEFRQSVNRFIRAMQAAGAYVKINATYRPPERAYIMHCAYRIARKGLDPRVIPYLAGVDICWVHPDKYGRPDIAASRRTAEQMTSAYRIAYPAALFSPHIKRRAIDMTISWTGTLNIRDANGRIVSISTGPRSGDNRILHAVGRTYGVHKFASDPPHWQDTPIH